MLATIQSFLWPCLGYLFGSISSAIIVSKLFGLQDPRSVGSGNPGATNVLRSGNKLAAFVTLLGDFLKGFIPVALALHLQASHQIAALVAIAAFLGHLYPIFFGFKGGKGVATALGVFAALNWLLLTVLVAVWLIVAGITRYSSLAALLASAVTALTSFAIFNDKQELALIGAVVLIIAFLFHRHRDNIERLKQGNESKIGKMK